MISFLKQIFIWWHRQTIGTFIYTLFTGKLVGVDEFGNNDGSVQFLTNTLTSIKERDDLEVSVFPVPATDFVTIELLNNKQVFVQLVDVSGKVVLEESLQNTTQLDISVFAKCIYYLSLRSEEYSLVKKIIIE